MAFGHHQAEINSNLTGQAAEPQSHNQYLRQAFTSHIQVLEGVGALFPSPSASRKGSQDDRNSHFDDDEAFGPQADMSNATAPADDTAQMHVSSGRHRPGPPSPLTPRGSPVHDLPYLPPEELPEFRRQRAARMKFILALDCHRPALEDTPKQSPVDTNFTSVEAGSEYNSVSHEHTQAPSWGDQTQSNRSIGSEYNKESNEHDSGTEYPQFLLLLEHTYNAVDAPGSDATQPAGPGQADDHLL